MKLLCSLLIFLILNLDKVFSRRNRKKAQLFPWDNVNYEHTETVPVRVDYAGQTVYPENKQFLSYIQKDKNSGPLYYHVKAFQTTFKLELIPDSSFVSPNLVIEHIFSESRSLEFGGNLGHCYYRARLDDSLSSAVFSLCNGLHGSFTSGGQEYFIERKEAVVGNSSKVHIIYRRLKPVEKKYRKAQAFCGVKESHPPVDDLKGLLDNKVGNYTKALPKRRRTKRYLDAFFLETMITADRTMVEAFHNKAGLEDFLITVMGMVARIYRHHTIGNFIKVVLVKIFILEDDLDGLHITSNAAKSLSNFCKWQKSRNKPKDSDPAHYDTAILITKRNICRSPGKCDTLGLAELGTVCSSSRSCAIVESNGLNTAFTIAHELAHVFNVPHDGDSSECTDGQTNIMAPALSFEVQPWKWSTCSRKSISAFLDLGYGKCLEDRPDPNREELLHNNKLPGEVYSANQQCRLIFGKKSRLCSFMEPCRRLWCVLNDGERSGCQTHHMPWADGTPCGQYKWCIKGDCVLKRRPRVIDGQWGQWSRYGTCTRTCGGGVSFSKRKCDNPTPGNGGRYCWGPRKRFRSCNTDECPPNSLDFRDIQCARLNNKNVKIGGRKQNVTWSAKYSDLAGEECKLYCRVQNHGIYFKVGKKVVDGTPCRRYSSNICVEGQCRKAGCDHIIGSTAKLDVCAVCKGDGSSCRKHKGYFNKKTKYGYNFVYDIPEGSTNILIRQHGKISNDENFLALQSIQSSKYLLNGDFVVGLGFRSIPYNGGTILYSGSETEVEEIKISGKTTEIIRVLVLSVGRLELPKIKYSLNIPIKGPQKFFWSKYGMWTTCNRLCKGRRRRQIICFRREDNAIVSNRRCRKFKKPNKITERCNTDCTLSWHARPVGRCSKRCGIGRQQQHLRCIRVSGRRREEVRVESCKHLSKLPNYVPCKGQCDTKWIYTNWSKCSKSCGKGIRKRFANCIDNDGDYLADSECEVSKRKILEQSCLEQHCPSWIMDRWSTCSVTCGTGVETRKISCIGNGKQFPYSSCEKNKTPSQSRPCTREPCPYWITAQWSECSVTCGTGIQRRQVICSSSLKHPKNIICNASSKPNGYQSCFKAACPPLSIESASYGAKWFKGEWTKCSVTCGKGVRTRKVTCRDVHANEVSSLHCDQSIKPKPTEKCEASPCVSWKHGQWGVCSKSCGEGIQLRIIKCAYNNWEIAEENLCKGMKQPIDHRLCKLRECRPKPTEITFRHTTTISPSHWVTGNWGRCSVTCGKGVRRRSVQCKLARGQLSDVCSPNSKPHSTLVCNLERCPTWITKDWSPCSVSCGRGEQTRKVTCDFHRIPCNAKQKPADRQECLQEECPTWIVGQWSKCSKTCGGGVKLRPVTCSRKEGGCPSIHIPKDSHECNKEECPRWTAGSWSQCSVSCGRGIQTRSVQCPKGVCDPKPKPPERRSCNIQPCPIWITGKWDRCSTTCDEGFQIRKVECSVEGGCNESDRPLFSKICNLEPCPRWIKGQWSLCSVSCGRGVITREVNCGTGSNNCDDIVKPQDLRNCSMPDCPTWTSGPWSMCSASCGHGVQKRRITCQPPSGRCDRQLKPKNTNLCNLGSCPAWKTGEWSKCSVSCSEGKRTRSVECNSTVFRCNDKLRPTNTESCNLGDCPKWTVGDWTACSSSCGKGVQARRLACEPPSAKCDDFVKPEYTRQCNLGWCPSWITGSWSRCSVSCGGGIRTRIVKCNSTVFKCDEQNRPSKREICNTNRCPVWTTGLWSECSSSCGPGIQKRRIRCQPVSGKCDHQRKPIDTRWCNQGLCPAWITGLWDKCSVSCGEGTRERSVKCNSTRFRCDEELRPTDREICNHGECPIWKAGDWSECSSSCGQGVRKRSVICDPPSGICDSRTTPANIQFCNLGLCPIWTTGPWTKCSVTCGEGTRTRSIRCNSSIFKCDQKLSPVKTENCNLGDCPSWITGHWSVCSVTCGDGVRLRTVECSSLNNVCSPNKPRARIQCKMDTCPKWIVGSWENCSATCGTGVQRRSVSCNIGEGKCDAANRPAHFKRCELSRCSEWKTGLWSECSVSCGGGFQKRTVTCDSDVLPCDSNSVPDDARVCNVQTCPRWIATPWSECSATCGEGHQTRTVTCDSDDALCDVSSKLDVRRPCNVRKCPTWVTGPWAECPVTCGEGTQTRTVSCESDGVACDVSYRPYGRRPCNVQKCPTWVTGKWSLCSVTCGKGKQTRTVTCDTDDVHCDVISKPEELQSCNLEKCPTWVIGAWTECPVTCGGGIQTRTITCVSDDVTCSVNKKPDYIRSCNTQKCPTWVTGTWTVCSVTCGSGFQTRAVTCGSDDVTCDISKKPVNSRLCGAKKCPEWKTGAWTECSVTCDEGVQTRNVTCDSLDFECDVNQKPNYRQSCNARRCPKWLTGKWTECSVTCGAGIQARTVTCDSNDVTCDVNMKPHNKKSCNNEKCPTWVTGTWSKCSVSCGKGVQARVLSCSNHELGCNVDTKPPATRNCINRCSKWIVGKWQKCSVTCGNGTQSRDVSCDSEHGPCDTGTRPFNTQLCTMAACPTWILGNWTQCSVSCGKGHQTRTVSCTTSDIKCNEASKPTMKQICNLSDCPSWKAGPWSECTRTCGIGVRSRNVQCTQGNKTLPSWSCDRFTRPVLRKVCRVLDCVRGAHWRGGPWAKCSNQCTKGYQTRSVECVARNNSQINSMFCNRRRRPPTMRTCNEYRQCGEWEIGPWSKCSTSCGNGVKLRAVRCLHNLEYTNENNCEASARPIDHLLCFNNLCPLAKKHFTWTASTWSKCSRTCGYGRKARRVTCTDDHGEVVSSQYCDKETRPAEFFPCFEVRCPPKWRFGEWSECSKSCGGGGYQVRPVTCEGIPGAGDCDARKKPPVWRPCNFGPCTGEFQWKVGTWTRCSVSCGVGIIKRSVKCINFYGQHKEDSFCRLPALKPDETRPCQMRPCTPRTCREIQLTSGLQADGEHVLEIQGKLRKVYCHGMTTGNPKEYITLKAGYNENFAEIYSKRLIDENSCPVNASHSDNCPCHPNNYDQSGGSYFSKIRFQISKMLIQVDDLRFAMTRGIKPPFYGTAGDCYSRLDCPQGRFSINLQGTGFELSPDVRWRSRGTSPSQVIYRFPEGKKVFGKCGGYCGYCSSDKGLQLVLSRGNELG